MNAMTDRLSTVEDAPEAARAARIQERLVRLGLTREDLIGETDRSRTPVFNALNVKISDKTGKPVTREKTWRAIEQAMDRLEAKHAPEPEAVMHTESGLIEIEIVGVFGVDRVFVRGPVPDAEVLEQAAAKIIRDLRERRGGDTTPIE